ncbi:MAG: sugar transferase [Spirochaetales bacterium]|nr:sugar transferase [Spirochaetales bacterium]
MSSQAGNPPGRLLAGTILLLLDALVFIFSFNLAYFLRIQAVEDGWLFNFTAVWLLLIILGIYYLANGYNPFLRTKLLAGPERIFVAAGFQGLIIAFVVFLTEIRYTGGELGRGVLLLMLLFCTTGNYLHRLFLFRFFRQRDESVLYAFYGQPELLKHLQEDLKKQGMQWRVEMLPDRGENLTNQDWNAYHGCIVSGRTMTAERIHDLLQLRLQGVRVFDLPDFYEEYLRKLPIHTLQEDWIALGQGFSLIHNLAELRIKYFTDFLLASMLLIVSGPILLVFAILIRLESRGPVIYRQVRNGLRGMPFTVYKFRSMRVDAESGGARWAEKNDPRVTRIGRFMRATRIDELPQLWNVLRGEMSFIGPRPERPEFNSLLEKEIPYYRLRHLVRPGLTGWAQVMYPYGASVADAVEKLQYDLYYIKNYSLLLDVYILLRSLRVVIYAAGR